MILLSIVLAIYLTIGLIHACIFQYLINKELQSCEHKRSDIEAIYKDAEHYVKNTVFAVFLVGILAWPYMAYETFTKK